MSNTPTPEELGKLAKECGIGWAAGLGGMDDFLRASTHAVLAKWGTPQPANLGFTIENRAGIDVLVWKDGGCQPATSAEVAMWKALSAVQQPVVQEPLTDEQVVDLYFDGFSISKLKDFARAIERAHGITKGGSNAE